MSKDVPDEVNPVKRELSRRRFLRNAGAAASLPLLGGVTEILSQEGAGASTYQRHSDHPFFASHPKYHFVVVNHVTTNPFFTATIYGIQDACALTGCTYQWTGSDNSIVSQMVSAFDAAIAARANGIACSLIDNTAFDPPVNSALSVGIPVIAYNADVEAGYVNNRMAYVGQSNLTAGAAVATHVLKYVKKGELVAIIIATPGTTNLQPRITGATPIFNAAGVKWTEVGTSATAGSPEYDKIASWYAANKDVKFMMSVDGGDSDALALFISDNHLKGKFGASGWDVGTPVVDAVHSGLLTLTIDQQAYLQGFVPIIQLFLYNISGGLMKPQDTDTGTAVITKPIVGPYLASTRWEGTSSKEGVLKPPPSIPL
ncbi:MAG TPA: substrate-binding domain-containing protein [Acidimicrobiales bacterium]|nr:substrate-binding domain-containing protein [Acidimicrobiales bacterium]